MNDKFLSLLGIAKKAGKLCSGHDAVKEAVRGDKAKLVIFTGDSSERLREEFRKMQENKEIKTIYTEYTMTDIYRATSGKAAVMCVTESGFAQRLTELFGEKHKEV
ncbi:MAG: L7Ae/L30e/S12e/Gadd45 family ribosomal protein [Acutalibacteraceae bacterium]